MELGKNRIEALSDGIFAIVMTLLILELHVPELPPTAGNVELLPALGKLGPKLLTYAASFVSLGIFWVAHHNVYHAIRRADRTLLALNILFFMVVSFLPFSASVLNAFPMTQIAPVFFGANIIGIGWILYVQWIYAVRQRDMIAPHVPEAYRQMVHARFLWIPVVLTLAVTVCFWSVEVMLGAYLLLMPFYMIPGARPQPAVAPATETA